MSSLNKSLKQYIIDAARAGDIEWELHEKEHDLNEDDPWSDCDFEGPPVFSAFVSDGNIFTVYATPDGIVDIVKEWLENGGSNLS